jgi:hypothetical protein
VLDTGAALPAHALLETYSVLTGFPPPHRAAPDLVGEWLDDRFPMILSPRGHRSSVLSSAGSPRPDAPAARSTTRSWP